MPCARSPRAFPKPQRVKFLTSFYQSSIGKKWIVALTGLVWLGYVIGHMAGNLQIFAGPAQINKYAAFLHSMPGPLWVIRLFLIACFILHVVTTIKLTVQNRAAKGQNYEHRKSVQAKASTKTMIWSGLTVLAFVIYHIAHFTTRSTDPRFKALAEGGKLHGEYDVHSMVILGFQNPLVAGFYILAVFLLAGHLSHGIQSVAQTVGANSGKVRGPIGFIGSAVAWLIFVGFAAVPVAVLAGKLTLVK